jgi:hypothetical protein
MMNPDWMGRRRSSAATMELLPAPVKYQYGVSTHCSSELTGWGAGAAARQQWSSCQHVDTRKKKNCWQKLQYSMMLCESLQQIPQL